jgi:methylated-DNA-[protein]-cysteine S-methyltransferase
LNEPLVKTQSAELSISTRDGKFIARYSERGLAGLNFPSREALVAPKQSEGGRVTSKHRGDGHTPTRILRWHRAATAALKSVLAGREPKNIPPLDLSGGTPFQKNVWRALRKISRGKTRSYGEIAREIGKPKAVRAVGGACGANPISIFVPCHRVLAANKKPGGFSGGLNWKLKLLALEGISLQ